MEIKMGEGPDVGRPMSFTMTRPDDMHLHLRHGAGMFDIVECTAKVFGRAIVMPNLKPPVTTVEQAREYHSRILRALLRHKRVGSFTPLMTLYLTDETSPTEIERAKASGIVSAVKYYPAGATTNSDAGVTDIRKVRATIERMEKLGMPLLVHGEVTDPAVDIFDREKVCIDTVLKPLIRDHQGLHLVMEHITTKQAVQFVESMQGRPVAATITPHHLLINRNALFKGGLRPHNYCLPVVKREEHREALLLAATSGNPQFFLGTDSAPHPRDGRAGQAKETACGCAGCFVAWGAMPLYAEAFDSVGKLSMLEGFASRFGADFYGLLSNQDTITLVREEETIPSELPFGDEEVVPFGAGERTMQWKVQ